MRSDAKGAVLHDAVEHGDRALLRTGCVGLGDRLVACIGPQDENRMAVDHHLQRLMAVRWPCRARCQHERRTHGTHKAIGCHMPLERTESFPPWLLKAGRKRRPDAL